MYAYTKRRNFSSREIETLLNIVKKHKTVFEIKSSNGISIREKQKAWRSITDEFNSIHRMFQRTPVQLQNLHKNLKRKIGKYPAINGSHQSYEVMADKEVISKKNEEDQIENLGEEEVVIVEKNLENSEETVLVDSSNGASSSSSCNADWKGTEKSSASPVVNGASSSFNADWKKTEKSNPSPEAFKRTSFQRNPPKPYFRVPVGRDTSKSSSVAEAFRNQAEAKKATIEAESQLSIKLKTEKHELKMKQMQEEHDAKMRVLDAQYEVLSKMSSYISSNSNNLSFNLFYNND